MTVILQLKKIFFGITAIFIAILFLLNPQNVKISIINGLLICGNVIIPSMFPFMVISLIIAKSDILYNIPFPKKYIKYKLPIFIFILSSIGGYPIGAKIICNEFTSGKLTEKCSESLLLSCINAGPSFVILTVGCGILNSQKAGILLYISHILSSAIIFLITHKNVKSNNYDKFENSQTVSEIFVNSVYDASFGTVNICGYLLISSAILSLVTTENTIIKLIFKSTLEIGNAILSTENIYILSAILGFGSFSVIFQIINISKPFSPKISKIILFKLLHSLMSVCFTYILLKLFPIKTQTISNTGNLNIYYTNNSAILGVMLLFTTIAFIYSLSIKKYCGKIKIDIF